MNVRYKAYLRACVGIGYLNVSIRTGTEVPAENFDRIGGDMHRRNTRLLHWRKSGLFPLPLSFGSRTKI